MILFCVVALSKTCRATGIIMALSFLVNILFYDYLLSLTSTMGNLKGAFIVLAINALTCMALMAASFKWKETIIVKQVLILAGFIVIDMTLTMSVFMRGNAFMDGFYNYYELIALSLYLVMMITIAKAVRDGARHISEFVLCIPSRRRAGIGSNHIWRNRS